MSLHQARQDFIGPLFQPTNNVGVPMVFLTMEQMEGAGKFANDPLLLTYKGPLASDRQEPHDIQVRVHRNTGSRKAKEPVAARAARWMEQFPDVYPEWRGYALSLCRKDQKHVGGRMITEHLRFQRRFTGGDDFKINDNVTPYMVRRFIKEFPDYANRFELRGEK